MLPDSYVAYPLTRERVQEILRQAERDKMARHGWGASPTCPSVV